MADPALAFVAAGGAAHEAEATEAFERWLRQFHSEREPWAWGVTAVTGKGLGKAWRKLEFLEGCELCESLVLKPRSSGLSFSPRFGLLDLFGMLPFMAIN